MLMVAEVMTKGVVTLCPDELLADAAATLASALVGLMAERSIHRVVVLDDASKLVGIEAPLDVLKAIRGGSGLEG